MTGRWLRHAGPIAFATISHSYGAPRPAGRRIYATASM